MTLLSNPFYWLIYLDAYSWAACLVKKEPNVIYIPWKKKAILRNEKWLRTWYKWSKIVFINKDRVSSSTCKKKIKLSFAKLFFLSQKKELLSQGVPKWLKGAWKLLLILQIAIYFKSYIIENMLRRVTTLCEFYISIQKLSM